MPEMKRTVVEKVIFFTLLCWSAGFVRVGMPGRVRLRAKKPAFLSSVEIKVLRDRVR
ncbi:MAG: hypothetical protein H6962_08790 [Chromatiaceae bacterium]|nr:hypothetical protein [Chromatiaceae bacterium]